MVKRRKLSWVFGFVAIASMVAAAYWWNSWPDRTGQRLLDLVEAERFEEINRMISGGQFRIVDPKSLGGVYALFSNEKIVSFQQGDSKVLFLLSDWKSKFRNLVAVDRGPMDRVSGSASFWIPLQLAAPPDMTASKQHQSFLDGRMMDLAVTIQRGEALLSLQPELTGEIELWGFGYETGHD